MLPQATFLRGKTMSDGIGSYYSPSPLVPVPMGSLGSYYSPAPLRPINGLGAEGESSNKFGIVVLALGILGFLYWKGSK